EAKLAQLMEPLLPVELAPYNFYFDHCSTSLTLVNIVGGHGNRPTGTIRHNPLAKCAFLFKTDTNC
ncbi:hypothetical protein ILUMI_02645, partial [Ignelater luminosus]